MTANRCNGWLPDVPDHRDYPYAAIQKRGLLRGLISPKPSAAYLHDDHLPVLFNQGALGSCVGHGVATVCAYAVDVTNPPIEDAKKPDTLSRLFAYWIARQDKANDTGAFIREGVKAVAGYGLPLEVLWPYDVSKFAVTPAREAFAEALHRSGIEYYRLSGIGQITDCIAAGFPVVYGMAVFDSFERVGADGVVPMPAASESVLGGHCMVIVGYSMKRKQVYVRNSWGDGWGARGFCWIPFDYIEAYADDLWTVRRMLK